MNTNGCNISCIEGFNDTTRLRTHFHPSSQNDIATPILQRYVEVAVTFILKIPQLEILQKRCLVTENE